ncbi:MAG: hypothetical protein V4689_12990 [Verrucomicrobiota bacterium]
MMFKHLALKFPSWFVAGAITIGSTVVFIVWWAMRDDGEGEQKKSPTEAFAPATLSFDVSDVVLCGNTLVNFKTGKVLDPEWLEGFGNRAPNVMKLLPEEKLTIISGDRGMVQAFGFDGKAKPMLQADGKPTGPAAYNRPATETIYVRDGNLYRGKANWRDSRVESPRKITDTGYFRPDTFRGRWLWHEDEMVVTLLGKSLVVGVTDGQVKEQQINLAQLEHGMSPGGTFALAQNGGRELQVLDIVSGALKNYTVGQKVRKILWLTNDRAVFQIGQNQIAEYDHSKKQIEGPQQLDESIRDIIAPSPDGNCFLIVGQSKITVIDFKAKKDCDLKIQFNDLEWLSDDTMLCSSSAVDTESRGVWLVKKTGDTERISNQPADSMRSNGSSLSGIVRSSDGGLFVSNGDLWSFASSSGELKQLTQDQKLTPLIQFLSYRR